MPVQSPDLEVLYHKNVRSNLTASELTDTAVALGEGRVVQNGPLVVLTGPHTGRSAGDKFIVREPSTQDDIWWGPINQSISEASYESLYASMLEHLAGKQLFVQDVFACALPAYRLGVRFVTEFAWHSLFVRNLFIVPDDYDTFEADYTVIDCPSFRADPVTDGTKSDVFVIINFARRTVLIGGTRYAGEMKKSIFTVLNTILPRHGVLPMHCSANIGPSGDTAIFFGLSGTGKTSLSADSSRTLIGDDEHGWSDDGVFNFEGGCYAKVIRLSPSAEPEIYRASGLPGTVLENVYTDQETGDIDFDRDDHTENTRAAYSIEHIPNAARSGCGGHPRDIVMLTCDAFGVLPPISRLNTAQAMYHFLSGYTAKIAGTEKGVTEPSATFSACFGAPFLTLHPAVYAEMLGERIAQDDVRVWLVNTGWTGGPYGVGERIAIADTRAMVAAALDGRLDSVPSVTHPVFGLQVPDSCPGVEARLLDPRQTWADPAAYDAKAISLARMFRENFEQYADMVSPDVRAAEMLSFA